MCQNKNPTPEFNSTHCKRVRRYGLHAMVFTLSMVDTIKSVANAYCGVTSSSILGFALQMYTVHAPL